MKHNLVKPLTYAGSERVNLIGTQVQVRPYYLTPAEGGSGFNSNRATHTYVGVVSDNYGSEMVIVRHKESDGPWKQLAAYNPRELHLMTCRCPACVSYGPGINEMHGA